MIFRRYITVEVLVGRWHAVCGFSWLSVALAKFTRPDTVSVIL